MRAGDRTSFNHYDYAVRSGQGDFVSLFISGSLNELAFPPSCLFSGKD
jgi:hypothetical protein